MRHTSHPCNSTFWCLILVFVGCGMLLASRSFIVWSTTSHPARTLGQDPEQQSKYETIFGEEKQQPKHEMEVEEKLKPSNDEKLPKFKIELVENWKPVLEEELQEKMFEATDPKRPFKDHNLQGRHSDMVFAQCNSTYWINTSLVNKHVGMSKPFNYLKNYKNPCWCNGEGPERRVLCIPYFYLIGMAKSGSTDLFFRIQKHPDVAKTNIKEYRWFDDHRFRQTHKADYLYYAHQLDDATRDIQLAKTEKDYHYKICGDASPSYSWDNINWYQLPENQMCSEPRAIILSYIHRLTPGAKLILILRNPVDRLYSHYLYHSVRTRANRTPEQFHEWADHTLQTYKECYKTHPFRHCMYSKDIKQSVKVTSLTSSIYSRLLLDILKVFPRNQLMVIQMEDYSQNLDKYLTQVYAFLGLDPLSDRLMKQITTREDKNKGQFYQKAGPMLDITRKMLTDFLQPFNEELAQMLNDDKFRWLKH